ncbi:sugar nucleotide-binding protein [Clostridium sp. SM-530-WT-3G]|uniref:SDR family oxidoreductase n=1 Tax=Clostridium sp. SM-530-WT-3G TaxID=2725303 RepID=UPI00145FB0AD|nr:sugar nucleotide-binding protein [Clostridium sp. SM-530-WT-3G]NME81663.1 NAD(P)-dependent oxidoreductase [Clostridium sp. SM-530-WT-3G]
MRKIHKVWLVGPETKLGQAILISLDQKFINTLSTSIEDVDVNVIDEALAFCYLNQPDAIINCYDFNDIDECKKNPEKAYKINAIVARNLAICSRKIGARFIHLSTDNVFGLESDTPYTEFDEPNATSVYGKSKLEGEKFVRDLSQKYFIVRTGYVYDKQHNYIDNNYDSSRKICPTSTSELAKFIVMLMNTPEYGVYHAHSRGYCTRLEFISKLEEYTPEKINFNEKNEKSEKSEIKNIQLDDFMLRVSNLYEFPTWEEDMLNSIKNK